MTLDLTDTEKAALVDLIDLAVGNIGSQLAQNPASVNQDSRAVDLQNAARAIRAKALAPSDDQKSED